MFSGFMVNAWIVATIVALVAGVVGFFIVLRGSAFVAHAVPQTGFAGAAAANLVGLNTVVGLGVFALASALGIAWLGRRGRHDVATALALVLMLGIGALCLGFSVEYAPEIYSLLFGEVLGVSRNELLPTAVLAVICIAGVVLLYRPLLYSSVLPEIAASRGLYGHRLDMGFLVVVALATTLSVPVVGAFLMFSLIVAPAGAAQSLTRRPARAIGLSVAIALITVWTAIAAAYETQWPVGFFVAALGALFYIAARARASWQRRRVVSGAV